MKKISLAKKIIRIFSWAVLLFTIFFFIWGIFNYSSLKGVSQGAVLSYGLPAIFIITFILDLFPQFLSGHNLVLVAGLLSFNPISVILVVLAGTVLASIVGFWIGKRFEEDTFMDIFGKKTYDKIDAGMNKYGKWYVLVSTVTPAPYVPILYGALDMDWKTFTIYGIIPRAIGFIITAIFAYTALPFVIKFFGI